MKNIDQQIRDALREEDTELYESLTHEPSLYRQAIGLFKGQSAWLSYVVGVVMIAEMIVAVYAGIQFYNGDTVREMLLWGGVCILCLGGIAALKIWSWMEMHKNALTRELKRLELQVATLVHAVGQSSESSS